MRYYPQSKGRDNAVGFRDCATDWTSLDRIPVGARCSAVVQRGPPSLLYNGYSVFPGGKAAGVWRWKPTPSSVEVKERAELCIYSPCWAFLDSSRVTFTFIIHNRCHRLIVAYENMFCVSESRCHYFRQTVLLVRIAVGHNGDDVSDSSPFPSDYTDCGILFHIKVPELKQDMWE